MGYGIGNPSSTETYSKALASQKTTLIINIITHCTPDQVKMGGR